MVSSIWSLHRAAVYLECSKSVTYELPFVLGYCHRGQLPHSVLEPSQCSHVLVHSLSFTDFKSIYSTAHILTSYSDFLGSHGGLVVFKRSKWALVFRVMQALHTSFCTSSAPQFGPASRSVLPRIVPFLFLSMKMYFYLGSLCLCVGVAVWRKCGGVALCPYRPYWARPQALHRGSHCPRAQKCSESGWSVDGWV